MSNTATQLTMAPGSRQKLGCRMAPRVFLTELTRSKGGSVHLSLLLMPLWLPVSTVVLVIAAVMVVVVSLVVMLELLFALVSPLAEFPSPPLLLPPLVLLVPEFALSLALFVSFEVVMAKSVVLLSVSAQSRVVLFKRLPMCI